MSKRLSAHEWETPAPIGLATGGGGGGGGGAAGGGGEGGEGGGALEATLAPLRLHNGMGSPIEVCTGPRWATPATLSTPARNPMHPRCARGRAGRRLQP